MTATTTEPTTSFAGMTPEQICESRPLEDCFYVDRKATVETLVRQHNAEKALAGMFSDLIAELSPTRHLAAA